MAPPNNYYNPQDLGTRIVNAEGVYYSRDDRLKRSVVVEFSSDTLDGSLRF